MEAHGHEEFWSGAADRREEAAATAAPPRRALPGREDVLFRVAPKERGVYSKHGARFDGLNVLSFEHIIVKACC